MPSHPLSRTDMEAMFNGIAHRYDFLNHTLSLGIDKQWRSKLVRIASKKKPQRVLDVATGTADLAIALAKKCALAQISGVDISENMLAIGRAKVDRLGLSHRIDLTRGAAEELPFANSTFDLAVVAFGVRNFGSPKKGLMEMSRVLMPGGQIVILEFTNPTNPIVRTLYGIYFKRIVPLIGQSVSGHSTAYSYLPSSVSGFAEREELLAMMNEAGFSHTSYSTLSFGVAAIYVGVKAS